MESEARMGNNGEKLRIAMFGQKRWSREGGIEVVVEELSTRMVKLGHPVTCYNRGGHHVSGKEFDGTKLHEYEGVKLKTVPTISRILQFLRRIGVCIWSIRCRTYSCRGACGHVLASKVIWKAGGSDSAWTGSSAR